MSGVAQPAGTVTMVFTDIEGSTRLLEELGGDAYRAALAEHRRVVREACARHGGYEVDYEGDAFFYAFAGAQAAVAAVAEAMSGLDGGPIRIRVGVHTGEPILDPPKYVGLDVHRAARIMSSAHGGQVVLSPSTVALLETGSVELRDLGAHRLKDLSAPIRLHQLEHADLPNDFPPLKTLYRSNLPVPAAPFVGRTDELAAVVGWLTASETRLLTLTGPGGTGKTRLALQAAGEAADQFPDGSWWVALASVQDPDLALPSVASVLGLTERPDEPLATTIARALLGKHTLVLLDNLEHLLPGAARDLGALLDASPTLKLLATSRARLAISAERVWQVPPMVESDGESLFVERARAAGVELEPDEYVRRLCRRLDELPLAIRLAAARTRSLSPASILERLDRQVAVLSSSVHDVDDRQRTLEATIAWSYELLVPGERSAFRALGVFAGGCTADAAQTVADASFDQLESLLDQSLLNHRVDEAGQDRYWMLETIREYALGRLEAEGEREATRRGHRHAYAERLAPLRRPVRDHDPVAMAALDADFGNARVALESALEGNDAACAALLLVAMELPWLRRGSNREARAAADRYLALDRTDLPPATRLDGDAAAGEIFRFSGEHERARAIKHDVLALARRQPGLELKLVPTTERMVMATLTDLVDLELRIGNIEAARRNALEALELRRIAGVPQGIAHALVGVVAVEMSEGSYATAATHATEAADLMEASGSAEATFYRVAQAEPLLLNGYRADAARLLVENSPTEGWLTNLFDETLNWLLVAAQVLHAFERVEAIEIGNAADALAQRMGYVLPPRERERLNRVLREASFRVDERTRGCPTEPADAVAIARLGLASVLR